MVIETSRWSKTVMFKACKAFGVNVAGFEHEILDLILRMEHKRQAQQSQQKLKLKSNSARKSRKKGEIELEGLKCGLNYDGVAKGDRGRIHKALFE